MSGFNPTSDHNYSATLPRCPSGTTFDYEFGGVTLQAQAGVDFRITEHWSTFVEYKGTYSKVDVPIDSGDRLKTDIFTNAVNLGNPNTTVGDVNFGRISSAGAARQSQIAVKLLF